MAARFRKIDAEAANQAAPMAVSAPAACVRPDAQPAEHQVKQCFRHRQPPVHVNNYYAVPNIQSKQIQNRPQFPMKRDLF